MSRGGDHKQLDGEGLIIIEVWLLPLSTTSYLYSSRLLETFHKFTSSNLSYMITIRIPKTLLFSHGWQMATEYGESPALECMCGPGTLPTPLLKGSSLKHCSTALRRCCADGIHSDTEGSLLPFDMLLGRAGCVREALYHLVASSPDTPCLLHLLPLSLPVPLSFSFSKVLLRPETG